jgi:hypothetical protein
MLSLEQSSPFHRVGTKERIAGRVSMPGMPKKQQNSRLYSLYDRPAWLIAEVVKWILAFSVISDL